MISRFTVRDMPLIRRHALPRWGGLDETLKKEVVLAVKKALEEGTIKEKMEASRVAVSIDKLNLEHEKLYTPKADFDVAALTDEELESQLKELETASADISVLFASDLDEELGYKLPMLDAYEVQEKPLKEYAPVKGYTQSNIQAKQYRGVYV